jgi:hypothetical protein
MKRICAGCGNPFEGQRSRAKYCGDTCRKRGLRRRAALSSPDISLLGATERELGAAGQLGTVLGEQALELARALVSPFTTGAAKASLSKEFRSVMTEILAGSVGRGDELDELRTRRDAKRAVG